MTGTGTDLMIDGTEDTIVIETEVATTASEIIAEVDVTMIDEVTLRVPFREIFYFLISNFQFLFRSW